MKRKFKWIKKLAVFLILGALLSAFGKDNTETKEPTKTEISNEKYESEVESSKGEEELENTEQPTQDSVDFSSIDVYAGKAYIELNNNIPSFSKLSTQSFESYTELDELGRCGVAYACVGKDIMPTEERGAIGSVKPTGWHTIKYDIVNGKYLYNRCHLIGFQLTGENANSKNLITGTRYMNVDGMLPFENMVADYVQETGNHVMYRVTPHFEGDNLLASGVQIEAYSVEDKGVGVCFNVYVYNVQPGITIDYTNGESSLED